MPKTKNRKDTAREQFARLVGISQPDVSQLLGNGVLTRDASITQWLKEYLDHLRKVAAKPQSSEDIRRTIATAHQKAVQSSINKLRAEQVPMAAVTEFLKYRHAAIRAKLLLLPAALRSIKGKITPKQVKSFETSVRGILKDLSKEKIPL